MDNNTPFMAIISLPVERRQRDKHKYMPKVIRRLYIILQQDEQFIFELFFFD